MCGDLCKTLEGRKKGNRYMFDWESGINLISKCVSKEQNMTELPLVIVSSPSLPEHKKGQIEENFVEVLFCNNIFSSNKLSSNKPMYLFLNYSVYIGSKKENILETLLWISTFLLINPRPHNNSHVPEYKCSKSYESPDIF